MAASGIGKNSRMGSRANVKNAPWGPGVNVILKDVTIRWKWRFLVSFVTFQRGIASAVQTLESGSFVKFSPFHLFSSNASISVHLQGLYQIGIYHRLQVATGKSLKGAAIRHAPLRLINAFRPVFTMLHTQINGFYWWIPLSSTQILRVRKYLPMVTYEVSMNIATINHMRVIRFKPSKVLPHVPTYLWQCSSPTLPESSKYLMNISLGPILLVVNMSFQSLLF